MVLLFCACRKCASTSIEKAIQPFCNINFSGHPKLKHINAQLFSETIFSAHKKLLPNVEIESFSLIRDPLERMESRYRYKTRDEIKKPESSKSSKLHRWHELQ
ncbi:sulfotransferase family 2 domain-containing protein [uncultured Paraglaciecola sp.]|uniref:sulfotransferase family 2 domain-containing protein n=1 Tax=uncultured Paraglaciecola sp. TaxID=1765024 RepID=UPI003459BD1A